MYAVLPVILEYVIQSGVELFKGLTHLVECLFLLFNGLVCFARLLVLLLTAFSLTVRFLTPKSWLDLLVTAVALAAIHFFFKPNYVERYQRVKSSAPFRLAAWFINCLRVKSPPPPQQQQHQHQRHGSGTSERESPIQRTPGSNRGHRFRHGEDNDERNLCVVCSVNEKRILLLPCKHVCLCRECWMAIETTNRSTCPVCRQRVDESLSVFVS